MREVFDVERFVLFVNVYLCVKHFAQMKLLQCFLD